MEWCVLFQRTRRRNGGGLVCGMKARPGPKGLSLALDEACLSILRTPNYIKKGLRAKLGVSSRLGGSGRALCENRATKATLSNQ